MNEEENYNAAKKYLDIQSNKLFFQIGTNDGNDAFRLLVEEYQPKKTFLVEPLEGLYSKIHESYKGKNYNLIEGVVHYKEVGEVDLYFPENDSSRTQHSTLAPMTNWNKQELQPVTVSAYNFNDICVEHNIKEIELLMLDTEGFDFAILNSIDFSTVKINNIITENFGFDTKACYTEYKDKEFFGKTGMDNIHKKLTKLNYKKVKLEHDTFFVLQ